MSQVLSEETQRAYQEIKAGRSEYARHLIRALPGYCIGCHSRDRTSGAIAVTQSFQQSNESWIETQVKQRKLSLFQKAQLLASNRSFNKAREQFEALLADASIAQTRPLDWERSLRSALGIFVWVENFFEFIFRIFDLALQGTRIPFYLRSQLEHWKQSALSWKGEPARREVTIEGLKAEAFRLFQKAHEAQTYPADRSADILFLRASAAANEYLKAATDASSRAEALLLLGKTMSVLRDSSFWELDQLFFASCIEESPHTSLAQSCFREYEARTYESYAGSGGTDIPADVRNRLEGLALLASPELKVAPETSANKPK
jgi:hypothetical protein